MGDVVASEQLLSLRRDVVVAQKALDRAVVLRQPGPQTEAAIRLDVRQGFEGAGRSRRI